VCQGYREIRLTSQDAGAFGHDTGESLVVLLSELDSIGGPQKYRLGMFNTNLMTDCLPVLLDTMKSDHFYRFFHVPLQSGSDRILAAMKRRYSVAEWNGVVKEIRAAFPDATIVTDIIVGFPDESEDDFRLTMDVISETRPDLVNVSKYGDRPRTAAAASTNKIPTDTKKERSRTLSALVQTITEESNRRLLGWTGPILVTETGPRGGMMGRMPSYRPVIFRSSARPGTVVTINIVSSTRTHLIGQTQARA
jgi:MiaB/RimO family radical SAM methylthiotransferase